MTGIFAVITIQRNAQWKNDSTLFLHDLKVAPNSVMVNANVAAAYIDKSDFEKDSVKKTEDLEQGIVLLNKAISLHKTYVIAYLNKALAYFKLGVPDSVISSLDIARKLYPNHPKLPEMYYNTGVTFYLHKQYDKAIAAWEVTAKIKPDYTQAQAAINTLRNQLQKQATVQPTPAK
jgi:tetratricopeptide (TPR) repeat protein